MCLSGDVEDDLVGLTDAGGSADLDPFFLEACGHAVEVSFGFGAGDAGKVHFVDIGDAGRGDGADEDDFRADALEEADDLGEDGLGGRGSVEGDDDTIEGVSALLFDDLIALR